MYITLHISYYSVRKDTPHPLKVEFTLCIYCELHIVLYIVFVGARYHFFSKNVDVTILFVKRMITLYSK